MTISKRCDVPSCFLFVVVVAGVCVCVCVCVCVLVCVCVCVVVLCSDAFASCWACVCPAWLVFSFLSVSYFCLCVVMYGVCLFVVMTLLYNWHRPHQGACLYILECYCCCFGGIGFHSLCLANFFFLSSILLRTVQFVDLLEVGLYPLVQF